MPQQASKITDLDAQTVTAEASEPAVDKDSGDSSLGEGSEPEQAEPAAPDGHATDDQHKKKKSRRRRLKDTIKGKSKGKESADTEHAGEHLSKEQMHALLELNPSLKHELQAQKEAGGSGSDDVETMMRKLSVNQLLTGLAPGGKNVKDMASHAFWKTQPVLSFDEVAQGANKIRDGPIKEINPSEVDQEPSAMYPGFEWVTMDLEDEKQLVEVYELLDGHYVEDQEAMFRFKYSASFLNWYGFPPACFEFF